MNLMYVLDWSGSMAATQLQEMVGALVSSLKYKAPNEVVGVYRFSLDLERSVPFTTDPKRRGALVRRPDPSLRTASRIYDAIGQAAEELLTRKCGSRSILAIADGDDRGSERNLADLIGELGLARIPVSIIEFNENPVSTTLSGLAGRTGGRYIHASKGRDLTQAVQSGVRLFSNRHAIRYRCKAAPAPEVRVTVKSPDGVGNASARLFSG